MVVSSALSSSCSLDSGVAKFAPHASLVFVQASGGVYMVLSKMMLIRGTSSTVFLLYQFLVATIFMAILAFVCERGKRPPLTKSILLRIFMLALIGVTASMNLFSASLYYITSTIQAAILNMMPVFTFFLTIVLKEEKLGINTWWGRGKLLGTFMSVAGALTLVLWRGASVDLLRSTTMVDWLLGSVMVLFGVLALSTWILMLRPTTSIYPAEISLNAIMFCFATLQTAVLACATSPSASLWKLKVDIEMVNIIFGAIFYSGLSNLFVTWSATMKGPIFVSTFSPLGLVFTTILETLFLGQTLSCGSMVGIALVVGGLYVFLWSKAKEDCCYCLADEEDPQAFPFLA